MGQIPDLIQKQGSAGSLFDQAVADAVRAGEGAPDVAEEGVRKDIIVQSGGIPRAIGNLALTAMFHAAAQGKDLVELDDVISASQEVV